MLHNTIKFSAIKSTTVYVSSMLFYSTITPTSWMEVLIARWEIVVIQHLMFHHMNLQLEEEASATVAVTAAAKVVCSHITWKCCNKIIISYLVSITTQPM